MEVKQVFFNYDPKKVQNQPAQVMCTACGSPCRYIEEGGRMRPCCTKCGRVHYKNPFPAVSVLIVDNDRFVLGKRVKESFSGGKWCLPCGFIEFDEDFITSAYREVKEETGLEVSFDSIINIAFNFLAPEMHSLVVVFLARKVSGELKAGDDLECVQWFSSNESIPDLAFEADQYIIERYFKTGITGLPVENIFSETS